MLFCANDDTISISWRVERGAPGIKISDMKVAETHDAEHSMMDQRFHDCKLGQFCRLVMRILNYSYAEYHKQNFQQRSGSPLPTDQRKKICIITSL